MPSLRLVLVAFALGVSLVPAAAHACSCAVANVRGPGSESCRTAGRVFAGTVGRYEWPLMFGETSEYELEVDTVWRGEVPRQIFVRTSTLSWAGSCEYHPTPGERFVVCDDEQGAAEPAIGWCYHPAFGEHAKELAAELGPGAEPAPAPWRRPWWTEGAKIVAVWRELMLLAGPFVAAVLSAGIGAFVGVVWPRPRRNMSGRTLLKVLTMIACVVIAARVGLAFAVPEEYERIRWVVLGPLALATAVGVVLGFLEVRRGRRALRGLFIAFAAIATTLSAGFVRLHFPVQPADAIACSEARAREHLRGFPDWSAYGKDRERYQAAVAEWARRAPAACTDWGLSRMHADPHFRSLRFPDGRGGQYSVHEESPMGYGWEVP